MNRKQRRKMEGTGIIQKFDAETTYRLKFDIKLPPGLLRDGGPSQRAGQLDATNEIDLTRGMFVRLLETFGFVQNEQAVVGLFASVVNPFPKRMRGALAYAIIQGTGLMIEKNMVEVCTFCEMEKQQTLDLENQPEEGACVVEQCGATQDEYVHIEEKDEWLHDWEESEPVMKDTTQHTENCPTIPENEAVTAPPLWKEVEAIVVLTPVMYEPLNQEKEVEEATGEVETTDIDMATGEAESPPVELDPGMEVPHESTT